MIGRGQRAAAKRIGWAGGCLRRPQPFWLSLSLASWLKEGLLGDGGLELAQLLTSWEGRLWSCHDYIEGGEPLEVIVRLTGRAARLQQQRVAFRWIWHTK